MECSTAKKKKRRTRKCLDEIRKRSRRMMPVSYYGETSQQHEKINKTEENNIHNRRLITMNRLTLNMFTKAVRSETITRPLLEEIQQKSSYIIRGIKENMKNTSSFEDSDVERIERYNSVASNDSLPMFNSEEESQQVRESSHIGYSLRDNHISTPLNISETPTDCITKIYSSTTTTPLSSHANGDSSLELYEELMRKISSHIKQIASALIKEDVVQNTKINLQKLQKRNRSKEYQMSMVEYEKRSILTGTTYKSSKESIVQNPLVYIRLNNIQQQEMCGTDDSVLAESSRSQAPVPAGADSPAPSPLALGGDCTRDIALYDTPEYNYYPHRLN